MSNKNETPISSFLIPIGAEDFLKNRTRCGLIYRNEKSQNLEIAIPSLERYGLIETRLSIALTSDEKHYFKMMETKEEIIQSKEPVFLVKFSKEGTIIKHVCTNNKDLMIDSILAKKANLAKKKVLKSCG